MPLYARPAAESWAALCSLRDLLRLAEEREGAEGVLLVASAGAMSGLPHHASTEDEMEALVVALQRTLGAIRTTPGLVTIALSSDDEYVPVGLDRRLLARVLAMLRALYGDHALAVEEAASEDGDGEP